MLLHSEAAQLPTFAMFPLSATDPDQQGIPVLVAYLFTLAG